MKFDNSSVAMTPEILKRKLGAEYLVPITIADSEFASKDVVKAGTPISATGTIANSASAVGILLNDVYKENPNGSLIKGFAVINKANAEKNSGLTIASAVLTALPNVVFE